MVSKRFLEYFVQKTYHERDVADVSQIYPNILWSKVLGDMPGGRGTGGLVLVQAPGTTPQSL